MKKITLIFSILFALFLLNSCDIDGLNDSTLTTSESANLNKIFDISTDNSGAVKITPIGEGASKFVVLFGHGTGVNSSASILPGQNVVHNYPEGSYTVTIKSYDLAGKETVNTYPLVVTYLAPTNLTVNTDLAAYTLNLSASAKNAVGGFLVYFGDVTNEVGTPLTGTLNSSGVIESATVSHNYASAGTYTVKVVALSGGAAQTIETKTITVFNPYSLPITYEDPNQNYGIGGTFGGVNVAVVDNPFSGGINTSSKVWSYTKTVNAASWSGTWTPLASPNGVPINIDNGSKIKVLVYSTEVGKELNVEIEQGSNGVGNKILKVANTVANQWEELTFDFGTLGIPAGTTFKQLVFRYNDSAAGTGEVIYIDNVTQTN